jgi:hypothetical protein
MDEFWILLKSWGPFIVLMAIWFFLIRRPIMRRVYDWAEARKQRIEEDKF